MSRAAWIITGFAWATYAISWFLPIVAAKPGRITDVGTGWEAFVLAIAVVQDLKNIDWLWCLCSVGVLVNVLVVMSPLMFRRAHVPIWFVVCLFAAFVLNLGWVPLMTGGTLLPGYWLWLGSMGLLAAMALVKRLQGALVT